MSYQSFANKWVGKGLKVDPSNGHDNPKEPYQCVSYIKEYLIEEFGIPNGVYGNAIDYWNKTAGVILEKFTKVPSNAPQQGDIVVLSGLAGNAYGHIMIATGDISSGAFGASEQNGATGNGLGVGGDAIRYRYVTQNRVLGLLRPKSAVVTASAPAAVSAGSTQFVKITGDYRTFYDAPNGKALTKLLPNQLGGGSLTYKVLDRQGDYVKIERQDGSGTGWIYVGTSGGANTLTSFFNA